MSRKSKAAEFIQEGYNVIIKGRNVLVTEPMKDYAIEKVSKIDRFSNRIIDAVVTMDIQKLNHKVDIIINVDHIKIKSTAITENMYASIDKAVDKIQAQLRRYKTKIQDHQAKGVSEIDMNVNVLRSLPDEDLLEVNDEIEDETRRRLMDKYHPHTIAKKEKISLKTLTDGEAIMKIDLSDAQFLIYRGEEDRKLKVIYRRDDGDFAIIEVES